MSIEEMPDSYREHQGGSFRRDVEDTKEKIVGMPNFGFQKKDLQEESPRQRLERIIEEYEKRHGKKELPFRIKKKKD